MIAEHYVKVAQTDPSYTVNYQHPLGKTILLMNHMWREQQYYAHVTSYQAQINPEKIKENFNNFKHAFWPHLVKYEKAQSEAIRRKVLKEVSKGDIGFTVQPISKRDIKKFNNDVKQHGLSKFMPQPKERR